VTKTDRFYQQLQILLLELLIVFMWIRSNAWMTILFIPTICGHVITEIEYCNHERKFGQKKRKNHIERLCMLSEKGYRVDNYEQKPDIWARIEFDGRLAFKFDYFGKSLTLTMRDGYYNYHRDSKTFLNAEKELKWLLDNGFITKATYKRMFKHVDEFLSKMEKWHWEEFGLLAQRKVD
jgi:hypothetical protein